MGRRPNCDRDNTRHYLLEVSDDRPVVSKEVDSLLQVGIRHFALSMEHYHEYIPGTSIFGAF